MTARNVPSMATVAAVLATVAVAMSSTPPVADGQLSGQYYSTAMLMQPKCSSEIKVEKGFVINQNDTSLPCSPGAAAAASAVVGARWDGHLVGLTPGQNYTFGVRTTGGVRFYVHGWKLVDAFTLPSQPATQAVLQAKWSFPANAALHYPIRLDFAGTAGTPVQLQLLMIDSSSGEWIPIPTTMLSSHVTPSEKQRQAIQTGLATGWNTWYRPAATDHVHLPTGFGFGVGILNKVTGTVTTGGVVDRCQESSVIGATATTTSSSPPPPGDAGLRNDPTPNKYACGVRPGPHEYNGTYTKLTQQLGAVNGNAMEVDTESAHVPASEGNSMVLLLTANVTAAANLAALSVQTEGKFYFDCDQGSSSSAGSPCGIMSAASPTKLVVQPVGFKDGVPLTVVVVSGGGGGGSSGSSGSRNDGNDVYGQGEDGSGGGLANATFDTSGRVCLVASWGSSASASASISNALPRTMAECVSVVAAAAAASDASLTARYGKTGTDNRDLANAIRSVVGWNTMYDPRIKVATPVSRSFGSFPYEMWLWDTFFCTLLASEDSKELAYSNLIEIARPTVRGNVPGFRSVGEVVGDRSKPYVGAMILKAHYRKFGDAWVVEQLFDDLLLWTNWIRDQRTDESNLVFLGTDNVPKEYSDNHQCTTTAAKWESGLDNSPMYDGIEVIKAQMGQTCKYPIYDVGMTGLYLSMCQSLADLAEEVMNRTDVAKDLRSRWDTTSAAMQTLMWSEEHGIFLNRLFNGTLSTRVSPFNFHPMISGVATVDQAKRMATDWLMNDKGFCLSNPEADDVVEEGATASYASNHSHQGTDVADGKGVLNLYYSQEMDDNTICIDGSCPRTVNASDGYVHWGDNQGARNEGRGIVGADGAAASSPSSSAATVALRNYYSATNQDNYVGIAPKDASYADLGEAGVSIYTNTSSMPAGLWSFDLYWSEKRKDMQNIANPITRKDAAGYKKVATLGFVTPTPVVPPPPPPPPSSKCEFGMYG